VVDQEMVGGTARTCAVHGGRCRQVMAEQLNALSHRYVHSAVSVRVVPARAGADAAPDAVEQARTATASLEQQALSPVQSPMLIQDLAIDLYPSHTGYRVGGPRRSAAPNTPPTRPIRTDSQPSSAASRCATAGPGCCTPSGHLPAAGRLTSHHPPSHDVTDHR
jgi:hypothetical protein